VPTLFFQAMLERAAYPLFFGGRIIVARFMFENSSVDAFRPKQDG